LVLCAATNCKVLANITSTYTLLLVWWNLERFEGVGGLVEFSRFDVSVEYFRDVKNKKLVPFPTVYKGNAKVV
jgi:hypothetical protein